MGHHTFNDENGPQAKWDALSYKAKKPYELEPYQVDDVARGMYNIGRKFICAEGFVLMAYHFIKLILEYLGLSCKRVDLTCKFFGIHRTTLYRYTLRVARQYNIQLARRRR